MRRIIILTNLIFLSNYLVAQRDNQHCLQQIDLNNDRDTQVSQLIECKYGNTEPPAIGSVISSFLDYKTLSILYGQNAEFSSYRSKWAPADGRNVDGSIYSFLNSNSNNVPDMRGLFVRGANDLGVIGVDPVSKNRRNPQNSIVEGFQPDGIKKHSHNANMNLGAEPLAGGARSQRAAGSHGTTSPDWVSIGLVQSFGGEETRPKNITVYYYIRIN